MLIVKLKNSHYSQNLSKKPGIAEIARVFVLLLILCCSSRSYARDSFTIRLSDSLKSSLKGFYVEKVINSTREDSCIGFVQVGAVNKLIPAYLAPSIRDAFGSIIMHSFPYREGLKPLIIRINELYIYEITSASSEISSIELSLSFITRTDSAYFEEYLSGVAFDKHSMWDVTHQHEHNIVAALERCFNNFNSRMLKGKLIHKPIPGSDLGKNPLLHTDEFPVMALKQVPKSVFRSYSDFREYKPDTSIQFTVKYTTYKKDSMLVQAKIFGLPWDSLENIWGFSDGHHPFIRVGENFYRLKLKNGDYITKIYMRDAGRGTEVGDVGVIVAAGIVGGVIGATIAGGIMGAATSNEIGKYKLDFATGKLIVRPIPDYMRIQSTMIFRLSMSSKPGIPLTIFYLDKKLAILNQDDYLKLIVPSGHNAIKLKCIAGDGATTELEFAVRLFHTDVFLLKVRKSLDVNVFPAFDEIRKSVLESMEDDRTAVVNL